MNKYTIVCMYLYDERRRLMYCVRDVLTSEELHITEEEWRKIKNEKYTQEEVDCYIAEQRAKIFFTPKKKGRKK